jgi:hypothetical protein
MTAKVQMPARFVTRDRDVAWVATNVAAGAGVCLGGTRSHAESRVGEGRGVIGGRTMQLDRLVGEGSKSRYVEGNMSQVGGTDPGP